MKKWMWAVSAGVLVLTAVILQWMPERVPMHYDISGNIDRWGSRYEQMIFPVIILILTLFMHLFVRYFEKKADGKGDEKERAGARSNARIMGITGLAMAAMFGVMHFVILYGAYTEAKTSAAAASVDIGKLSCILTGVLIMILGNYMPKTRINGAIGLRISWSMYNEQTWKKSNRFGGIVMIIAGLLTIVTAVLMKHSIGATVAELGYICLAAIVSVVYAHRVYVQEKASEKGGKGQ